ncbi:hypothetical protein DY000_02051382 [Brassica cretica]|uniref:Replication protein A 70 kDa DNA-binding subunit B/D first OB fold domain-containing protein n=1 Tax=Brassica cretica TaxID=69181 RepID=A0ABQ7EVQ9_BRACR|nr:hypothetical protein DY000_02051382 [Brassica cretica]
MAGFDEVSQLKPYKSMWRIKVKIIRIWKQYTAQGGETIEMVLVDFKGDKIHTSVKKDLVEQFDPVLMEGFTKILINFAVTYACGSYRTTKHAYKIAFVSTTKVRPCEELPMNLTGFTPAKFLDVLDGSLNTDYLVDVIGQIVEYRHVEIVSVNGKDTEKITVELRNENDVRLTIVLWGKFAMNVSDAIQLRADHAVEISTCSIHTILAACGLEHKSSEVHFVPPSVTCPHDDMRPGSSSSSSSLMKGCCSSCFDSFVEDVVKMILDTRQPHWLRLGLH